ncbi:uncharacterized protein LOC125579120 [Brassica napus]|uniref:uncharacterized protein LOC125579120 n=1 Tax=Brassica napus TaxID=3708 RepID=UPI002078E7A9|nr:uncharacterized protein LOC125579120 [Brassica napus]
MAIYLTAGAVEKLANGDVRSEIQMMPVLHVLKSTIVVVNRREAAVLWLTDGQGHEIRALLKGDLSLVKDKIVGSGSNIQLLQFTTGTTRVFPVQRFVSIIAANVILSSSDVIGQPHSDVIGQPQGPQQNFDVEPLVANTQESNSVKPLVADELKIFRNRIKDAKAFVCDTRTTKDGIRAAIRCFDMIITKFNMLLSDLRVPLEEPRALPSNDDSEDLYMDQLRLNASSLI